MVPFGWRAVFRIIPARAGFTWRGWGVPPMGTDHPRSRGVYYKDTVECIYMIGSSPLARGLLSPSPILSPTQRIIPARAGFTMRST